MNSLSETAGGGGSPPPSDFVAAYPEKLWEAERKFLLARLRVSQDAKRLPEEITGVALSGGGIRSATFCLGVFQALAKQKLLGKIDYLSTVSGGGYFGAFFGALFARRAVRDTADVEKLLDPGGVRASPASSSGAAALKLPDALRWLRENGRYLSPNGAGDLLVGGAVMLRNWVAIHVVLFSLVMLALLALQLVRAAAPERVEAAWWFPCPPAFLAACAPSAKPYGSVPGALWWSPLLLGAAVPALLMVIPTGWAYWLIGRLRQRDLGNPLIGVGIVVLFGLLVLVCGATLLGSAAGWPLGLGLLSEVALTFLWLSRARVVASRRSAEYTNGAVAESAQESFKISEQRNFLSHWLKGGLILTAVALAIGVIDSVGQTIYLASSRPGASLFATVATMFAPLAGAAAFGQRLAVLLGGKANGKRLGVPTSILVTVAALVVVTLVLLAASVVAHGIAWHFEMPRLAPTLSWESTRWFASECDKGWSCRDVRDVNLLAVTAVGLVLLCLAFGQSWPFLNNSSLHSMYSARLTRAYLGASNPGRASDKDNVQAVTRVIPGDNAYPWEYWRPPAGPPREGDPAPCAKGAPLHLINVTVNETMDGRSQIQQQDRKGVGLALGPCAFSVGVRHHAVFASHAVFADPRKLKATDVAMSPSNSGAYAVFGEARGRVWRPENLTVGEWVGISGAAFSTGLGSRTSLGLSVLCGLANVRLGYWWNSDVKPSVPARRVKPWARAWRWLFPLQDYFFNELFSRFPGTARPRWYLSDGGHFENMGGYELIRRRLTRIVVIDAEADPEYRFEGLANLVRKARLDFGAEITFLTGEQLDKTLPPSPAPYRPLFGTIEELRRGKWAQEPITDTLTKAARLAIDQPIDQTRYSRAHAALARVTWSDEPARTGWLLYLKPTLTGDEPADVIQYHRAHPAFPQETTADQFFDEAQWESYRMLGFVIGDAIFASPAAAPGPPPLKTFRELIFGS